MNNSGKTIFILLCVVGLFSCSEKPEENIPAADKAHFMSEKMQAIKKAEAVNQLLQDADAKQRQRIDEDSQ